MYSCGNLPSRGIIEILVLALLDSTHPTKSGSFLTQKLGAHLRAMQTVGVEVKLTLKEKVV